MTLNKTESLRLYSNNDISSQSQVNIMPKRKRDRITDPAKKQTISANMHNSCDVLIMVVLQLGVKSVTHCSIYARYATYVSDSRLIPHIVCNQLRPDPNNSPRLSGKYRVSSPVLFALYWQSNSSRRCGLSDNQGTTNWPPAANEIQLKSS